MSIKNKDEQIKKCMNMALDKSTTEEEALTAFKMARKLSKKQEGSYDDSVMIYTESHKITLGGGSLLGLTGALSKIAVNKKVFLDFDFNGMVMSPTVSIKYSGKEKNVKEVVEFTYKAFDELKRNNNTTTNESHYTKDEKTTKEEEELKNMIKEVLPIKKIIYMTILTIFVVFTLVGYFISKFI